MFGQNGRDCKLRSRGMFGIDPPATPLNLIENIFQSLQVCLQELFDDFVLK